MKNSTPVEMALSRSRISPSSSFSRGIHQRRLTAIAVVLSVLLAMMAAPVQSAVPGEVNYQGLLLDNLGVPVNGTTDFEFRLFSVATAGSALWTEVHSTVPVVDGVYDVVLGSLTPIPPAVLSGGTLYLEVSVDTEILSPRQRLLAVPYALRAAVAEETDNVFGIPSSFFGAIMTAVPWDGSPPGNFDPSEGLVDTDGDSLPNFMDPDNDNDGLSDAVEVAAGSDINLKTPNLLSVVPTMVREDLPSIVTLTGTNFEASMTVQVGSEIGVLSNVTATSVDVSLGLHPAATENVFVTLTNGETDSLIGAIEFFVFIPVLVGVSPNFTPANVPVVITISGSNFESSMVVQVGAEIGVLSNITATSADVSIGGHALGVEDIVVTLMNGQSATLVDGITFTEDRVFFVTSSVHTGVLGGIAGADTICNARATEGGLAGVYQAWLSDGIVSPATRSTQVGTAYVDSVGGPLAADWAALMSPSMGNVRRDENGVDIGSALRVWTNVDDQTLSSAGANHCSGWTSGSGTGSDGITGVFGINWTNAAPVSCALSNIHLYCIQQ